MDRTWASEARDPSSTLGGSTNRIRIIRPVAEWYENRDTVFLPIRKHDMISMRTPTYIAACLLGCVWFAHSAGATEIVNDFHVSATLNAARHLEVEETITYDFGDVDRYGIYRKIPITYRRNGGTYRLRLTIESVTRDDVSEPYETKDTGDRLTIKIGQANRTVTGRHVYRIRYATDRAINFFPDGHSELYWNVTGNEWPAAIERTSFTLTPPLVEISSVSTTCFTGEFGSTERACALATREQTFSAASTRVILPGEGLTVAFAFPRGIIQSPTIFERLWQLLQDNGVLFFPLAALFIMHGIWWKKGRDPKRMTVVPEYDPPRKLLPAVIGSAITDGDVPPKTVTATMIDLARKGFLKIRFGEEKQLFGKQQTYAFVKQQRTGLRDLAPYEAELLEGLFNGGDEQTIEDLKQNSFYEYVKEFKNKTLEEILSLNIFVSNPSTMRGAYFAVAFLVGFFLAFVFSTPLAFGSAVVTGLVIASYGWFMPQRTFNGVKLLAQIEGFKWFLSVTEKDRLAFTDAPARTPEQFQKFLPYAIALGVEEQWAQQFASLTIPPPNWANGNLTTFSALWLVSNLATMHDAAKSSAYAAPSQAGSGGSGFGGGGSGGGFGGGGGGSW